MQFLPPSRAIALYWFWLVPCRLSGTKNHHFAKLRFSDFQRPLIYGRMLMITLFYQASLRLYNRQVMQITESMQGSIRYAKIQRQVTDLRQDFIRFTNVYWFHDVTSQIQGREVFKLQQQALELKREYDFIKDEMERMDEFLQSKYNQRMGCISLILTALAVFISVMQFDSLVQFIKAGVTSLWQYVGCG